MTIFLVGFMGSGKTYWGSRWAKKTGFTFFDLDELIEKETGSGISAIFEEKGETQFRQLESEVLHRFAGSNNCIVACGGGTACFNNNMNWMNTNGTTVYLKARPSYLLAMVNHEKEKRPLISKLNDAETLHFIQEKLGERERFYKEAQIILAAEELNDNFVPGFIELNP